MAPARLQRSTKAARRYDGKDCPHCGWPYVVYVDPEGTWVECACDAGYAD
jgi:hypothetical protein